ncbi:MAG: glycosyltransferase family 2 protein [Prevotella sp.]|nr:glycosyltransferase family 2 protein [Prevotella sp.]
MKLSVIIPVYHVETTLDRCVRSVLNQQVKDGMEVVLVDDGSPDRCPFMCDEWAKKDDRIRVVHKDNGGLSDARNAGIDVATGELITFIDSDDWLSPDTYQPLIDIMGNNDILEYSIAEKLQLQDHVYTNIHEYWLKEKAYAHTYAWNKIYRRQLFESVRYPKGHIFEDVYTLPFLLRKAHRIATTAMGSYHYTQNPEGITANADGQGLAQLLEAHLTSGMPIDDLYYMYLVNIQIDVWEQMRGTSIILPKRKVNTNNLPKRHKAKGIIHNILGIKSLCRITKAIHCVKAPSH